MGQHIGRLLIAVGIGHLVVGIAVFHVPLTAILRDGVVDTIPLGTGFDRQAAFWFLFATPVTFLLGQLTNRAVAHRDGRSLRIAGWYLLGMGVVGVTMMPTSGFWLLLALAPLFLKEARRLQDENSGGRPAGALQSPRTLGARR